MKFPAFIQLAFAFLLLAGCAAKPPAVPDWISGESAQYNKSQYLIGRGQAAIQEDAKDRARADLSKIFQVSVAAESEDVQKFKTGQTGQGEYAGESSRRITTRTSQIIRGIQIVELWQDPLTKTHHALAILPRLQTAASLRQQIGQLDEAASNHIEQSRKNTDLFLKISAANLAIESLQERESLQKSLQVVDPTGRGAEAQWSSAKLGSDLDELLKRVSIAPRITVDSNPALAEIVAGALAKAGFMIEAGPSPEFTLEARLGLTDLGFQEGWYWQRGVLEVTLSEAATKRVRGTKRWNIKGNASDRENAVKRALGQADTVLKQELRPAIIEMAISR
ncbi:MAG: LPP20 family lipoprotein [Gallionellaceae bacterium]|nr:LPP20 family lipoprotein [Gallionellaceae bacterium]